MAWTDLPISAGFDWTQVSFLNQFWDAIQERLKALDPFGDFSNILARIQVGDDVQRTSVVFNFQQTVEDNVRHFLNSADFPDGFDKEPDLVFYDSGAVDHADWRAAASIPADGFTRKYPRTISNPQTSPGSAGQRAYLGSQDSETTGSSNGATRAIYQHDGNAWIFADDQKSGVDVLIDHGRIEAGDYIGEWLFNELYRGIDILRWTMPDTEFDGSEFGDNEIAGSEIRVGPVVGDGTYNGALAAAQDAFANATPEGLGLTTSVQHWSKVGKNTVAGGEYNFTLVATQIEYSLSSLYDGVAHAADLYVTPHRPRSFEGEDNVYNPSVFGGPDSSYAPAADGSDMKWWRATQLGVAATTSRSATLGNLNEPTIADDPEPPPEDTQVEWFEGMSLGSHIDTLPTDDRGGRFVLRWDVPGGFEFVS